MSKESLGNDEKKLVVSIITTCYKDLSNLKATAKSVLDQVYPVEWIIIDADSGIETTKYLKSISSNIHSVKWVSEKDNGLYEGMNKGFIKSSGSILLFLNAGDLLAEEDSVSKIAKDYKEFKWNWAVALAVRINDEGTPLSVWEYLEPEIGGLALGTRTFCHQATFYTREFIEDLMPYDITNLASDHLLNVRCFKKSHPRMLPFVSTFFLNGGLSSKRPFSAAMKDLRRIRKEEKILLYDSYLLDLIASFFVINSLKIGGITWAFLRNMSRTTVKESQRTL
jgi:glycosyltransferase involved in cell wall biosynthesis